MWTVRKPHKNRRRAGAVRRSVLHGGQAVEGGRAGAQGDRLHADLRAARDHPRRGHAAAGDSRRRRPARGDPGRRLLPELHLPHSALDHRTRAHRAPRFRRRHAVPVDLRRDPQPVSGMWQDHVPEGMPYVATSTCRRTTRTTSAASSTSTNWRSLRDDLGGLRGKPITDDELRRSIAVYNENRRAGARAVTPSGRPSRGRRRRRRSTCCCARAWCCRSRSTPRLLRDYMAAATPKRPRRDNARVVVTGAFCEQPPLNLIKSIEMAGCYIVDDDFMLVNALAENRRRARRDGDPLENLSRAFLHRSAARRPNTTPNRRQRAACSGRGEAAATAPKA